MKTFPIRLQKEGKIIVPQSIQEQLNLREGDWLTFVQIDDLILLTLKQPQVPQLADQISTLREQEEISINELIEGLELERKTIWQEQQKNAENLG
jgi:bifunctional DNA-binding transcriptional regulator/antitoxin component of YhaV-PrlF toxin-antitoxin module